MVRKRLEIFTNGFELLRKSEMECRNRNNSSEAMRKGLDFENLKKLFRIPQNVKKSQKSSEIVKKSSKWQKEVIYKLKEIILSKVAQNTSKKFRFFI